jgi:hypothetical protein
MQGNKCHDLTQTPDYYCHLFCLHDCKGKKNEKTSLEAWFKSMNNQAL